MKGEDPKMKETRQRKLAEWIKHDERPVRNQKSYISQLLGGKASFGEKAARNMEQRYGMPDYYLDGATDVTILDEALLEWIVNLVENDVENRNRSFEKGTRGRYIVELYRFAKQSDWKPTKTGVKAFEELMRRKTDKEGNRAFD